MTERISVDEAFNPELRQAQQDFDTYLETRPFTQDERGRVHHAQDGTFAKDGVFDEHFDQQRDDHKNNSGEAYEGMSVGYLARKYAEAHHLNDQTTADNVIEVLDKKIGEMQENALSQENDDSNPHKKLGIFDKDFDHNADRMNAIRDRVYGIAEKRLTELEGEATESSSVVSGKVDDTEGRVDIDTARNLARMEDVKRRGEPGTYVWDKKHARELADKENELRDKPGQPQPEPQPIEPKDPAESQPSGTEQPTDDRAGRLDLESAWDAAQQQELARRGEPDTRVVHRNAANVQAEIDNQLRDDKPTVATEDEPMFSLLGMDEVIPVEDNETAEQGADEPLTAEEIKDALKAKAPIQLDDRTQEAFKRFKRNLPESEAVSGRKRSPRSIVNKNKHAFALFKESLQERLEQDAAVTGEDYEQPQEQQKKSIFRRMVGAVALRPDIAAEAEGSYVPKSPEDIPEPEQQAGKHRRAKAGGPTGLNGIRNGVNAARTRWEDNREWRELESHMLPEFAGGRMATKRTLSGSEPASAKRARGAHAR